MATTAQWGSFEWGEAEWGSIEDADAPWSANGALTLNGAAAITLSQTFIAAGALALAGAAGLTTIITMVANGNLVLVGDGNLKVARFVGRLRTCGEPLTTANQDWILK